MRRVSSMTHSRAKQLYQEAQRYFPGGVNSNFRLGMRPFPLFFECAHGSKLRDVDGNEYIDYALGMGPIILGHADPRVTQAVAATLAQGTLFAGQHEDELKLGKSICETVPCAEMVRFSLSGSEAIHAGLRVARAFTGRQKIIKFEGHYHGWFDNIYVSTRANQTHLMKRRSSRGVPGSLGQDPHAHAETLVLPWNDIGALRRTVLHYRRGIAAVIMEPIMCNTSVILPRPGYLESVRQLCSQHGIVLIFDEVITGFRVALAGAQQYLGVKPDLAVFAKALANGYPISCLAGRRDIMKLFASQAVMHGGTFNANAVTCAAALATLKALGQDGGCAYDHLERLGSMLKEGLREEGARLGCSLHVQGLPSVLHTSFTTQKEITDYRSYLRCQMDLQSNFVERLLGNGVRITDRGTWFLSTAHTEQDIRFTLQAVREVLRTLGRKQGLRFVASAS